MSKVERLSEVDRADFPSVWYEVATESHFWFEWRLQAFLRQLRDLDLALDAPLKVIEIGCGHGVLRRQMERKSRWVIDGADMNLEALEQNHTARGRTLLYNIHDRRPEFAGHYDAVILFDVIEHIADAHAFLDSALYHLKPGGLLFINVPALESLRTKYDEVVGHLRRYDKGMMRETLTRLALRIADLRYWGLSSIALLLLRRLFTPAQATEEEMVRAGLKPPNEFVNLLLTKVAMAETSVIGLPPRGTSLLAAAVKE